MKRKNYVTIYSTIFFRFCPTSVMSHVSYIAKNKHILETRAQIIRLIREFFWSEGFLELETPTILRLPGQEPYLFPMKIDVHNERGETFQGYLHTSPEYTMKKMLAAGFEKIFSLGKVFRDHESFGGTHNPEFTMIEWYHAHKDFYSLMDDVEKLIFFVMEKLRNEEIKKFGNNVFPHFLISSFPHFQRAHMRDLWQEYVGVNLDEYLTVETMYKLCVARGYTPSKDEPYEDVFFRIFLNEIEMKLPTDVPIMVHHYPLPMAALSKASATDIGYAERVEMYWGGMELANGFTELTDATEQRSRLEAEKIQRRAMGKDVFDVDAEFVDAVGQMPPSAGIALGVDRLVQVITGEKNIDSVLALPMSQLFDAK